jgi:hypothetical protein
MALTTGQKISLFEIIDTPYTGNVDEMYGKYGLSALTYEVGDEQKVQLKIFDRLNSLTGDEETVLLAYVEQWQAIGTQVYNLDGGTGGIDGVSYNPNDELARIRERVKNLIPVRHYWENLSNAEGNRNMSIDAIR